VRRLLIVVAALVLIPIVEIAVLIAVGKVIGVGLTLVLMLATSALGAALLRHQGSRAWQAFRSDLEAGRPPGRSATDGLLVLFGGVFMLVPGFISDVIGVLLIAPPTRRLARAILLDAAASRMSVRTASSLFGPRRIRVRYGRPRSSPRPAQSGPAQSGPAQSGPAQTHPSTAPAQHEPRREDRSRGTIEGEIVDR
jgi:UPF0716 protein FxsA